MAKKFRGNGREVTALNTYVKMMRAVESLTARVHRHLSSVGLTVSQFGVLEALYHLGPLSQREIGQKILRSSGNITLVIDNLEKRGLVMVPVWCVEGSHGVMILDATTGKIISEDYYQETRE